MKVFLAGYPMIDVKVAVYEGSYHPVDSNEMAFKTAARIGFQKAVDQAEPVLLEPMAHLEITVPDSYAGSVMGDVSASRGRVEGMSPAPAFPLVKLPLRQRFHTLRLLITLQG